MDKMIKALSWTLIHSLWQGLLFAIITGALLMIAKRSSAARRYNLALTSFLVFGGITTVTFIWECTSTPFEGITSLSAIRANLSSIFPANVHDIREVIDSFTFYFSANAPLVVLVWLIFFMFKSVKLLSSLVYSQRVRSLQVAEPEERWKNIVTDLSEKLKLKKTVKLLQSGYVKMPMVIGHLKPVILIPAGLLSGLPAAQVEAILLHELAHIRRNDYIINFLQNIAETIFFFNPGLLWISSLLREERENSCDDIALSQTKNERDLVQALVSFKEYELYGNNYATAFPGKKNYLLRRVTRIIDHKNKKTGTGEKIFFAAGILVLMVIIAAATISQIDGYATAGMNNNNYTDSETIAQPRLATRKTDLKNVRADIKISRKVGRQKIVSALPATTEMREPAEEIVSKKQSAFEVVQKDLKQAEFADEQMTARNEIQARLDDEQALKDQQQALLSQKQAREDWQQALKDQARARLDEVQAKRDQEQALKDQADADAAKIKFDRLIPAR